MAKNAPTSRQLTGSEFCGVERTVSTVQPTPADTLTNAERLRLGYLTGDEKNAESVEDRRQFWGLRPADGKRPNWLQNAGIESEAERQHLGQDPLQVEP